MQIARCDKTGGISLKESLRTRYGDRFVVVEAPDELVLLPIPDDPVEDLGELGGKLPNISLQQLRAKILERARREVNR